MFIFKWCYKAFRHCLNHQSHNKFFVMWKISSVMVLAETGLTNLLPEWGDEGESWEGGLKTKNRVDYTVEYETHVNRVHMCQLWLHITKTENWTFAPEENRGQFNMRSLQVFSLPSCVCDLFPLTSVAGRQSAKECAPKNGLQLEWTFVDSICFELELSDWNLRWHGGLVQPVTSTECSQITEQNTVVH